MHVTSAESAQALVSGDALTIDALHRAPRERSETGAWYDAFPLGPACFAVTVGDTAGGRVEAAAIAFDIRAAFNRQPGTECGTLLRAADAILRPQSASATAIVGIVDCAGQTFSYICIGHAPPFVRYRDDIFAVLPTDGMPCGRTDLDHPLAQVVVDLADAEMLVLYSNVLEAVPGLDDAIRQLPSAGNLAESAVLPNPAALLAERVLGDSHDDAAVLALRFAPAVRPTGRAQRIGGNRPHWSVSWSFDATGPASNGARRAFLAYLGSKNNGGKALDLAAAELIFGELLGNVVRHAPGQVEITLDWTDELPVLHVLDNGPGFQSRRARERLPADDLSECGRGLFIINACAAQFTIRNRTERGSHACVMLPPA